MRTTCRVQVNESAALPKGQRRRVPPFSASLFELNIDGYTKRNGPISLNSLRNQFRTYEPDFDDDPIHSFTIIAEEVPTAKRSPPQYLDFNFKVKVAAFPDLGLASLHPKDGALCPETPSVCTISV
jgi:hypothetical protein